jgi:hypothetical protein
MKMYSRIFNIAVLAIILLQVACKGKDPQPANSTVNITMKHEVNGQNLELESGSYTNTSSENYSVSTFKYIVSNFVLTKTDGSVVTLTKDKCIHFVNASEVASQSFQLTDVPAGDYASLSFVYGIDSATNMSQSHDGVPGSTGMFWAWNSGYIFMKYEGKRADNTEFVYHIAGSGGTVDVPAGNNVRLVTIPFGGAKLSVGGDVSPKLTVNVNTAKIFDGTSTFTIQNLGMIMTTTGDAGRIASNAAQMYSFGSIE